MMRLGPGSVLLGLAWAAVAPGEVPPDEPPRIELHRLSTPIHVDGDLSDAGWQEAAKVETFYETNPGDNVPPPVKTTVWLGYDAKFFYAAFLCEDPDPGKIRAPYVDRDNVFSDQDFVGVILDARNDKRSAIEFFVNPRGIQDDFVVNDATGNEDPSPDFFWDSAGRILTGGWSVEMRIPFSSLRYPPADPATWGVILYRNYPRDYRHQIFNVTLPRGGNCLVCREAELTGIADLPQGGHLVVAPYLTAKETGRVREAPDSGFRNEPLKVDGGGDVKWTPGANTALDATINPDFSQIESDVAQIAVNQRFALFFPEKRPFFLESVDLLETPVQAVYTRTITSPRWGARVTGKLDGSAYTLLVTQDRGGGSVIVPGPQFSSLAPQDFSAIVGIGRLRRDVGRSFAGILLTDRENEGDSYNRVAGPDFQWRPSQQDEITGQFLYAWSKTPNRPDLSPDWNGQRISGGSLFLSWLHSTRTWTWRTTYQDVGEDFRADDGFVPRVGYRRARNFLGYTFYPTKFLSRLEPIVVIDAYFDRHGGTLDRRVFPGVQFRGMLNSFGELDLNFDAVRVGSRLLHRRNLAYDLGVSLSRFFPSLEVFGFIGQEIDFDNARVGDGGQVSVRATLRPTDHVDLQLVGDRNWLDVVAEEGRAGRLFTATVARLKATYTFTARAFLRLIGQYVETRRDPSLYAFPVERKDGAFAGSLLFSYKLNWQSVLFVGYGDNRAIDETGGLARTDRQFFLKISYAFQR